MYEHSIVWRHMHYLNIRISEIEKTLAYSEERKEKYETTVDHLIRRGATFNYGPQGDYLLLPSGLDKD